MTHYYSTRQKLMDWTLAPVLVTGIGIGWSIARRQWKAAPQLHDMPPSAQAIASSVPSSSPPSDPPSSQEPSLSVGELKEKLQQLELAYGMATEMGQFKAGFLARTSHELRSPLNSIMSLQQLILTDLCDNPEEERDFISQSYTASQKLLALLNETTNVSKLEEGTTEILLEPLSLSNIFSEVENLTHLQALNRNLKLFIKAPSPDIVVMGDYRWLRQVLVNLVTTSIYQMNGGKIQVTAEADLTSHQAHIVIEDERSPTSWSEPIDLLKMSADSEKPTSTDEKTSGLPASSGLTLIMTQIMMEKMKGTLSLLSKGQPSAESNLENSPTPGDAPQQGMATNGTRIQCSLPLAQDA
ncbi:MAG: HAMP domain-containing sensor histidine kinase [Leptolyngbyaceae bacterium]|nr:HAMP domain-containing sensor histidine kinase [Leptolyngbyaceae bacterium]